MKKLFVMAVMLLTAMTGFAQEKDVLCVAKFTYVGGNEVVANSLRNEIIQGIVKKDRLEVVDISTQNLPSNKNEALKALNEKGFQYLLEGKLNTILTGKSSDGKYYTSEINYTLTVTEVATGLTKVSETYKDTWHSGDSKDEAIMKSIDEASKRMDKFVDDNFKVEASIKALDQIDEKKNAAKSCYVTTGSAEGVQKGQIFEVFAQMEIAGEMIDKKIGELKAKEIMSPTLTLCDVKNGGDAIKRNFEQKIQMKVRTRATKDTFGLRNMFK